MRVNRNHSRGPEAFLELMEALVRWINETNAEGHSNHRTGKEELIFACERMWPTCDVYQGHTHLRITPSRSFSSHLSAYVDLVPQTHEEIFLEGQRQLARAVKEGRIA